MRFEVNRVGPKHAFEPWQHLVEQLSVWIMIGASYGGAMARTWWANAMLPAIDALELSSIAGMPLYAADPL